MFCKIDFLKIKNERRVNCLKKLKSPLNIALCIVTAVLCITLLAALCFWISYASCSSDANCPAQTAKDVCNVVLPLIGICVMCIIISVRSTPKHGKR